MIAESIKRLSYLVDNVPQLLFEISEEKMSVKLSPQKWSKKEILGHLIDSATNNHHRFVRGQFETNPEISYDQNNWNKYNFYQEIECNQIINFWSIYNRQLIEVIKRIPPENLNKQINVGEKNLTLALLIIDYVKHLDYHLKQIIDF